MPRATIETLLAGLEERLGQDEAPLKAYKEAVQSGRLAFADLFNAGTDISALVHAGAEFTDRILTLAWEMTTEADVRAALVAVGGYGRGELHPGSDVDLLILTAGEPSDLREPIESLVMFLWDIGLEVGHSARNVAQCVEQAREDVTVMTNLVESRLLAGDPALFGEMLSATGSEHIWASSDFFGAKIEEQRKRYAKYDDTGQKLEPNVKESPGGLRDIQTVAWVAKRHFGVSTMQALVGHGFLTDHEYQRLKLGQEHLWRIRYALHLLTGRHEDRLFFEHQRLLAHQLGYTDADANLAVEQFMQDYYRTTVEMQRLNEMLLQLFDEAILLNNQLGRPVTINRRFQARGGYLEVRDPGIFARYPMAMLEMFLVLQQHPQLQGVRASTIRLLRAHRHLVDARFRRDIRARALFLSIFRENDGLTHATRRMHRYGILTRYLPAFNAVTGLMQFDLFHVYTVDEHILMVIRNMRRFALDLHREECPYCNRIYARLAKPELLYFAGLFHDIAKGRGGDHSRLGARDAREFCHQHDLSDFDANLVGWLVEKHLVMSYVAQNKDIDDPEVVQSFAETVATKMRLDYLYLLTVADMRGTNPTRWNSWKSSLLERLHKRTLQALERGLDQPQQQDDIITQRQAEAREALVKRGYDSEQLNLLWMSFSTEYFLQNTVGAIIWHTEILWPPGRSMNQFHVALRDDLVHGCTDVFVYGPDRDDLFAHTTALLDQLSLNVLSARIYVTETGVSFSSFLVLEAEGGSMIEDKERLEGIRHYIADALNGSEMPGGALRIPRRLRNFQMPSDISFIQDDSRVVTLMILKTSDRPGLLSMVGQVFAKHRLRLHGARIATAGAEARDTFAITDREDQRITDPGQLDEIAAAIRKVLDQ